MGMDTTTTDRLARIRVPLAPLTGVRGLLLTWYSKRSYGALLDPALVLNHVPRILIGSAAYERNIASWKALEPRLKTLAVMAAAARIGCSWCLDFGYYAAQSSGEPVERLREVPRWRESDVFDATERAVLAYAEAITDTPPTADDDTVADLIERLGVPAVVELTKMVSVENERSRFNLAMGLSSQGLSDRCEVG